MFIEEKLEHTRKKLSPLTLMIFDPAILQKHILRKRPDKLIYYEVKMVFNMTFLPISYF